MLMIFYVCHNPKHIMDKIEKAYTVKKECVGVPECYLFIETFQLPDGRESWSMSSCQYVENAVKIVKGILAQEGMKLKGKADCPYPQPYRSEVDVSQELEPFLGQCYQKLIGIL